MNRPGAHQTGMAGPDDAGRAWPPCAGIVLALGLGALCWALIWMLVRWALA